MNGWPLSKGFWNLMFKQSFVMRSCFRTVERVDVTLLRSEKKVHKMKILKKKSLNDINCKVVLSFFFRFVNRIVQTAI